MTGKDAFAEAIESFRASVQDAPPRQLFPDPDALLAEVGISSLAQESADSPVASPATPV